jgi:glycosyl transferase family 25
MNRGPLPPVWVVNLERSVDRRERMRHQLNGLGLAYEFVKAVDGRELTDQDLAKWCEPSAAVAIIKRELTRGEVGCSLSHLRLYDRMIQEGHEEAVILEDDVNVNPVFVDIFSRRELPGPDWEMVVFHGLNKPPISCWNARRAGMRSIRSLNPRAIMGGW